jgi:PAS domain S-box-containing protein
VELGRHGIGVGGFIRDVTDRKRAEEALRESEERFRRVTESLQEAVWSADLSGQFDFLSPIMAHIYGRPLSEMMSNPDFWIEASHPEDQATVHASKEALFRDYRVELEYRIILPDGTVRWIADRKLLLRNEHGEPYQIAGILSDITERKRSEEEKRDLEERLHNAEKMEMMGKLAGRVAHDLNNVLGVLSGYSELLTERIPVGSPLRDYAANIFKSSGKAAAIVEDLLTLTRRGVRVMEVAKFNKVIADLLAAPEFDKLVAYHPNVIVKTDLANDLLNISGSPVHIEKTVMNLVSNAVEAIVGDGEVIIKTENRYLDKAIESYQTVMEGEYVVLTVSDTGKGIPASELKNIFEPFYTKKSMGRSGTGMGLAIVWGAVQDHNGYIDVQSIEGKGTTFTLYFPATREKAEAETQKIPMEQYVGHGESVLVVDDVQEQREVATTLLTQLG